MNLPEITKPVFVSVISKQIKLNDYNRCFWMWLPFSSIYCHFFFFFFLLSLVPGIIQAQYTSAQETLTELDNVSKAYFQIQYLLLSVTDPNKF